MNDNNQNENSSGNGIVAKIIAFITFLRNFISSGEESTSGNLLQNKKVQIAIGIVLLIVVLKLFGSSNGFGIKLFLEIIFYIALVAVIYFGRKLYLIEKENNGDTEVLRSNEDHQKFFKFLKIAAAVCVVSLLAYHNVETDEDAVRKAAIEYFNISTNALKAVNNVDTKYKIKSIEINGNYAYVKLYVEEYLNGLKLKSYDMDFNLEKDDKIGWFPSK